MCGICGIISLSGNANLREVRDMADIQKYRGPDSQGFVGIDFLHHKIDFLNLESCFGKYQCTVGFNRLAIRDLSINGSQPMVSADGQIAIVFNGEIYNTEELKRYVQDYSFRGFSDTEVILALYQKLGIQKTTKLLDGMFAFVIVDVKQCNVFFVRDRVGIKPLYYYYRDGDVLFSSEIKSFLSCSSFQSKINLSSLHEMFTFGTSLNLLLKDVYEIHPGEILKFEWVRGCVKRIKFFDVNDYIHPGFTSASDAELDLRFMEIIENCVKRQMASDVHVGCQLSGGIDSSLIAYFCSKFGLKDVVSIVQEEKNYSEIDYIKHVIGLLGLVPHLYSFGVDGIKNKICKAVWHYEDVITFHNVIALMDLSYNARKDMKVVLTGEGADELLGGYTWFEDGWFASRIIALRQAINRDGLFDSNLLRSIRGLEGAKTFADFAISCTDVVPADVANKILKHTNYDRKKVYEERKRYFNHFSGSDFDKLVKYEMSVRLRSLLLRQDKACMANSVENRVPYLDNEMIDFSWSVSEDVLIKRDFQISDTQDCRIYHKLKGKAPMKRIAASIFGGPFAYRRKMGFPMPFHKFMYASDFREYLEDEIFPSMRERGILSYRYIRKQYDLLHHVTDEGNISNRWLYAPLWKALTFEIFCRQFIDKRYEYIGS